MCVGWLLDVQAVRPLLRHGGAKRVIAVEGNATGQFASVLRGAGALGDCEAVLRYDGMPFTGEEIAARVTQ